MPYSLLCLANNTSIVKHFSGLKSKVMRIYKRKAHVHHYTQYMEQSVFDEAIETLEDLMKSYMRMGNPRQARSNRLQVAF